MAPVRVFLCTYRRPRVLRRALRSLLAQTFTDWICELHNDAPDDDSPRALLDELAPRDPRFVYRPHDRNWGAVATFNHAYAGGPEPYASLLEDDNWWEPAFLATANATLERWENTSLVWANMRVWDELPGGEWRDTGRTIWAASPDGPAEFEFRWPELYQAFDALHSHGAMVFRPGHFRSATVPHRTPLPIIEHVRERAAAGSLVLLTTPLAHFARTRQTARDRDAGLWMQARLLVAASFFRNVNVSHEALRRTWAVRRALRPRDTGIFFLLAFLLHDGRFIRDAHPGDWLHFLASTLRHPRRFGRALRCREAHAELWRWLETQAAVAPGPVSARTTVLAKSDWRRVWPDDRPAHQLDPR